MKVLFFIEHNDCLFLSFACKCVRETISKKEKKRKTKQSLQLNFPRYSSIVEKRLVLNIYFHINKILFLLKYIFSIQHVIYIQFNTVLWEKKNCKKKMFPFAHICSYLHIEYRTHWMPYMLFNRGNSDFL